MPYLIAVPSFLILFLSGCVTLPTFIPEGKFYQIYQDGMIFVEVEKTTIEDCAKTYEREKLELKFLHKINIAKGTSPIKCSATSFAADLRQKAEIRNVLTGEIEKLSFWSKFACEEAKERIKINNAYVKFDCL